MTAQIKKGFTLTSAAGQAKSKLTAGFTLIELLIVMAILGVLAVVVLVAINPAEQLRRARDAGRISGTQQIGRAISAFYTVNGCLPGSGSGGACAAAADAWGTDLTLSEELQTIPAAVTPITGGCGGDAISGWCYDNDGENFIVYTGLESQQKFSSCSTTTASAYAIFSSEDARGGVVDGDAGTPGLGGGLGFCDASN